MRADPTAAHVEPVVLEARGIDKSYGRLAVLRNIDLTIHKGEVVVLVGPSGSGKSTLLRMLNLLERPDRGDIRINGVSLGTTLRRGRQVPASDSALSRQRRHVGMVFQQFNLFGHMTALANVMSGPVHALGTDRATAVGEARRLLALVGLADKEQAYPAQLSGGQQQRVAIARALAMHPDIILFDEPTSALDPEMVSEVLQVMLDLSRRGMTMVIVTHEIQFALKAADRILFMDHGRIIEEGKPNEVVDGSRHERTRRFLSLVMGEA